MIVVTASKKGIEAKGHATTLICNSVSVLLWSLSVALEDAHAKDLDIKEGDGFQKITFGDAKSARGTYQNIVKSIKLLAEQFPAEINFIMG